MTEIKCLRNAFRDQMHEVSGQPNIFQLITNMHPITIMNTRSSCTCGIDEIRIDSKMKRPIYIGVYGYLQYQMSYYHLFIEFIDTTISTDENYLIMMNYIDQHKTNSHHQ